MATPARLRANAKYDKTHTKQIKFKLNLKSDADILEKLATVPSMTAYFKALIRADIEKEKKNESDEI